MHGLFRVDMTDVVPVDLPCNAMPTFHRPNTVASRVTPRHEFSKHVRDERWDAELLADAYRLRNALIICPEFHQSHIPPPNDTPATC